MSILCFSLGTLYRRLGAADHGATAANAFTNSTATCGTMAL
jgi:hypothetical protein